MKKLLFLFVALISCQKDSEYSNIPSDEEVYTAINKAITNFEKIFVSNEFKEWKNPSESNYQNLDENIRKKIEAESAALRTYLIASSNSEQIIARAITERSNQQLHSVMVTPCNDAQSASTNLAGAAYLACIGVTAVTTGMTGVYLCHVGLAAATGAIEVNYSKCMANQYGTVNPQ